MYHTPDAYPDIGTGLVLASFVWFVLSFQLALDSRTKSPKVAMFFQIAADDTVLQQNPE